MRALWLVVGERIEAAYILVASCEICYRICCSEWPIAATPRLTIRICISPAQRAECQPLSAECLSPVRFMFPINKNSFTLDSWPLHTYLLCAPLRLAEKAAGS